MIDSAFIDNLQIHNTAQYILTDIDGLGSPKSRANRSDRPQRHGQLDYTKFYGPRVVALKGVVIGTDVGNAWDLVDLLKGAFALQDAQQVHTFKFQRSGKAYQEQLNVTVDSEVDVPSQIATRTIPWGVTLVAADPRIYAAVLASASYDPTTSTAGGGVSVVGGMTVVGGITFSSTTITRLDLTNNGNFSSPVRLTITGPAVNPIIDNDTLGSSIALLYNMGINDTIVVDTSDRSVLLNGASRPDLLDVQNTTWYDLTKGINSLRMRATGMVSGQSSLTAAFRDARI